MPYMKVNQISLLVLFRSQCFMQLLNGLPLEGVPFSCTWGAIIRLNPIATTVSQTLPSTNSPNQDKYDH